MPRPKPDVNKLLEEYVFSKGYLLLTPIEDIENSNTYFTLQCPANPEHTVRQCFTSLKKKPLTKGECVHCQKEVKYKEMGTPISAIQPWFDDNDLTITNPQEYYNNWEDQIHFKCNKCGDVGVIKSINHFVKNTIKKSYKCLRCLDIEKGIITTEEYEHKVKSIRYIEVKETIVEKETVFNIEITEKLKEKFKNQKKWKLLEYYGTKKKCLILCLDCGNKKWVSPHSIFLNNGGCAQCHQNNKNKNIIEKLKHICLEKGDIYPINNTPYIDSSTKIKFKCNKCGHEFDKLWNHVEDPRRNFFCPQCHRSTKRKSQNNVAQWIQSLSNEFSVEQDVRNVITPLELDIVIPEKRLAIEYCGLYWHSEKMGKDSDYHKNKLEAANEKEYRLITIFEDEWNGKQNICKSLIKNALGLTENRICAKKCFVEKIDNEKARGFCNQYHIQGPGESHVAYGLYYEDKLVSVMTFSKPSASKDGKYDWELNRFCSLGEYNVIGGTSKLLKAFSKTHEGVLVSFCDLRWETGGVYEALGMTLTNKIKPKYYTDSGYLFDCGYYRYEMEI